VGAAAPVNLLAATADQARLALGAVDQMRVLAKGVGVGRPWRWLAVAAMAALSAHCGRSTSSGRSNSKDGTSDGGAPPQSNAEAGAVSVVSDGGGGQTNGQPPIGGAGEGGVVSDGTELGGEGGAEGRVATLE